jgi:hypothetical protein
MRRWLIVVVAVLAVLDLGVLAVGYRARAGTLPAWQVPEPAFGWQPPSGPSGDAPATSSGTIDTITGPVLMAVDADGLVLRATRGACEERFANTAQVAVGSISSGVKAVELPALAEVLGVAILPDDHLRVSGLRPKEGPDGPCAPVTFDSTDSGQTWEPLPEGAAAGIWRLDPDTTADRVTGPAGGVTQLDCVPLQLSNLPGSRAAVSCDGGAFYIVAPRTAPLPLGAGGYDDLSVAAGPRTGRFYVFGSTADCPAQVASASAEQQAVVALECLDPDEVDSHKAPLAIAAAGGQVVVQLGNDLMVSDDGGQSFTPVG